MKILNTPDPAHVTAEATPTSAQALLDAARVAKVDVFFEEDTPARRSDADARLRTLAAPLASMDPALLESRDEALAFWVNLYNAIVIHGAIALGVREEMGEARSFFKDAAYRVCGLDFNLDIIEHGLLRDNRGHPSRVLLPQLRRKDPRRRFVVSPMDIRVHFALNCGAASCPPVRHYTPEAIDAQLDAAARSFVMGGGVDIDAQGRVSLSKIFQWYVRDFGLRKNSQLDAALGFVDDPERARALQRAAREHGIVYQDYDWSIA